MSKTVWNIAIMILASVQFTQAWDLVIYCDSADNNETVFHTDAPKLLSSPCFKVEQKIVFITHGYRSSLIKYIQRNFINVLLKLGYNVIGVDYAKEAGFGVAIISYPVVVPIALNIGKELAVDILNMVKAGLEMAKVHLIGVSLGAQMFGLTCRELKEKGFLVPRLTGCDPAGPFFENLQLAPPISRDDAGFVDIMHTNRGGYGMTKYVGHADFVANDGKSQPGCPPNSLLPDFSEESLCPHSRCYNLTADAYANPGCLLANKYNTVDEWRQADGAPVGVVSYGPEMDTSITGVYFFSTNAQSTYCRGQEGLRPLP